MSEQTKSTFQIRKLRESYKSNSTSLDRSTPYNTGMKEATIWIPTLGTRMEWLDQAVKSIEPSNYYQLRILCPPNIAQVLVGVYPDIEVVPKETNNLSNALNHCLSKTTSEYFSWIGDDDQIISEVFISNLKYLIKHRRFEVLISGCNIVGSYDSYSYIPSYLSIRGLRTGLMRFPQPGSILKTASLRKVQGFNEENLTSMDYETFCLMLEGGMKMKIRKNVAAVYRDHKGTISRLKENDPNHNSGIAQKIFYNNSRRRPIYLIFLNFYLRLYAHFLRKSGLKTY